MIGIDHSQAGVDIRSLFPYTKKPSSCRRAKKDLRGANILMEKRKDGLVRSEPGT